MRVLEARIAELAADVFEHLLRVKLDRHPAEPTDPAVVVEGELAAVEVVGDATEDRDDLRFGEKGEQAVGDQHGRAVAGDGIGPALVGERFSHRVCVRRLLQRFVADSR